jgi:UDP-3-O-[3-hydroxymyristoyl] N-acetylglucosamine deacetylase
MISIAQKTINHKISCNGVGLHSGSTVTMTLHPAPCDSGIIFKRTDVEPEKQIIRANYKNVTETNLGTTLTNEFGVKISTIEHLMAAIWGCGIDNLIIEINANEAPIMDGSSKPLVFLIECAGINIQDAPRRFVEILKTVRVEEKDKFIEVKPANEFGLELDIDFDSAHIGEQKFSYNQSNISFKNDISRARTFGFKHEIDYLHSIGLAKGGTLDNAILVGEEGIINEGKLRYENEFARHKALDFIGDIYLAGHYILGHFTAFKPGHGINNKILQKIFENQENWRLV